MSRAPARTDRRPDSAERDSRLGLLLLQEHGVIRTSMGVMISSVVEEPARAARTRSPTPRAAPASGRAAARRCPGTSRGGTRDRRITSTMGSIIWVVAPLMLGAARLSYGRRPSQHGWPQSETVVQSCDDLPSCSPRRGRASSREQRHERAESIRMRGLGAAVVGLSVPTAARRPKRKDGAVSCTVLPETVCRLSRAISPRRRSCRGARRCGRACRCGRADNRAWRDARCPCAPR